MTLAEMKDRYHAGWSAQRIGDAAHLSEGTVRNRLRAMGVEIRSRGRQTGTSLIPHDEIDRTIALYREHGSRKAAEILGVHWQTVLWRVERAGELVRPVNAKKAYPAIPEGFVDTRTAAAGMRTTRDAVLKRCARGQIDGARRESTWPHRWLIPEHLTLRHAG